MGTTARAGVCRSGGLRRLGEPLSWNAMEKLLRDSIVVPFDTLFLDPNNPRLAVDDAPGYAEAPRLFASKLQAELEKRVEEVYDVAELAKAIVSQGWMPIDSIVV